jgi:opacity protein-like surface antigen
MLPPVTNYLSRSSQKFSKYFAWQATEYVANATPKEKLTMRTTNFSKETVCAIAAVVAGMSLTFTGPSAHAGPFKNVVPSVTTETEYLWNGPYLAFNSGAVWTNFNISDYSTRVDLTRQFNEVIGAIPQTGTSPTQATAINEIFFDESGHESTAGAYIGGADLGYNFQFGHFVVGAGFGFSGTRTTNGSLVRDFQSHTVTGLSSPPTTGGFPGVVAASADTIFTGSRHAEQNWSGYAGVQLGFAWQRFLFYAMGGSAFSQIDMRTFDQAKTFFVDTNGSTFGRQIDGVINETNNVLTGWYAGGGMQYAFTDALRAGLEYRHSDYGDRLYHFNHSQSQAVFPGATRVDVNNNEVVFKVSIMLGHLSKTKK